MIIPDDRLAELTHAGYTPDQLAVYQELFRRRKRDETLNAVDPVRIALRKMIDFMKSFNGFADGYCMCGDTIESYNPYHSNHSPVDAGEYHAALLIEEAEKALS